jgi:signal peptidase I
MCAWLEDALLLVISVLGIGGGLVVVTMAAYFTVAVLSDSMLTNPGLCVGVG